MLSLKSMKKRYCISDELESKGCVSACSKFIMYAGESIEVIKFKKARAKTRTELV